MAVAACDAHRQLRPLHPRRKVHLRGQRLFRASIVSKLSPRESHILMIVHQERCPSNGTSQRTAAVPAKAPSAARISLSLHTL